MCESLGVSRLGVFAVCLCVCVHGGAERPRLLLVVGTRRRLRRVAFGPCSACQQQQGSPSWQQVSRRRRVRASVVRSLSVVVASSVGSGDWSALHLHAAASFQLFCVERARQWKERGPGRDTRRHHHTRRTPRPARRADPWHSVPSPLAPPRVVDRAAELRCSGVRGARRARSHSRFRNSGGRADTCTRRRGWKPDETGGRNRLVQWLWTHWAEYEW